MRKNLTVIGNSLGLIIEKPILELLGFSKSTDLEMTTGGKRLIIESAQTSERSDRIRSLTREVMRTHEKTFRKLAD